MIKLLEYQRTHKRNGEIYKRETIHVRKDTGEVIRSWCHGVNRWNDNTVAVDQRVTYLVTVKCRNFIDFNWLDTTRWYLVPNNLILLDSDAYIENGERV